MDEGDIAKLIKVDGGSMDFIKIELSVEDQAKVDWSQISPFGSPCLVRPAREWWVDKEAQMFFWCMGRPGHTSTDFNFGCRIEGKFYGFLFQVIFINRRTGEGHRGVHGHYPDMCRSPDEFEAVLGMRKIYRNRYQQIEPNLLDIRAAIERFFTATGAASLVHDNVNLAGLRFTWPTFLS